MRIRTSKSKAMVLSQKRVDWPLQVRRESLPLVLFMSEGKREQGIDRQIGAASALMQTLKQSVVVKRETRRQSFQFTD